ncbi:MAG: L,D-transpeptidase family protein [Anaerocolumna sp.]
MTRIITRCKLQKMIILCIGCLLLSLFIMNLPTSAKTGSPYYIKVNKQQNCVTVYEKDKAGKYTIPVKAMACSTGPDTPLGTYNTLIKYRWKLLMGDVWGQYSTRIVDGILFHSVWYYKMDETTLSATQYNKLGTSASHGCIRLNVSDVKWLYDNCPIGTTVEIYNGKDPGPLGKPETIKIPAGSGWDPTDPSKNNPYKDKKPIFKGAMDKSITWGSKTNLLNGVKAASTTGTDITSNIKVEGKIDVFKAGKYKIKYTVSDAIGRTAQKTVTYTVNECKEKPRIEGVTDRSIGADTIVDKVYALEGVTAYLSTKKLLSDNIQVKITKESEDTYIINYSIKAENKLTGKAKAAISVDRTPPVIEGTYFREITQKQLEAGAAGIKKLALKDIKVTDDYSILGLDKVKVTVKAKEDYAYLVTYEVSDEAGNITSETVQYTYFKGVRIDGVANHYDIPGGTAISEEYVKQGIAAINSDNEECTDLMTVKISSMDDKVYQVTYSIADTDGQDISLASYFIVNGEPGDTTVAGDGESSTAEDGADTTANGDTAVDTDTDGNAGGLMDPNTLDNTNKY